MNVNLSLPCRAHYKQKVRFVAARASRYRYNIMMRLFSLLLMFMPCAQADSIGDYRYQMPLIPVHEGGQHRLELPLQVYLYASQADLTDLRLFNAAGDKLPYAFFTQSPATLAKPAPLPLNWFALTDTLDPSVTMTVALEPDGTLTAIRNNAPVALARYYLIDASGIGTAIDAMQIEAEADDNALRHLSVEGSDDLRNWRAIMNGSPWLSVHSGTLQLNRKRIEFSPVRCKYYRLSWDDHPATVSRILVEAVTGNAPPHYLHHTLNISQNPAGSADYQFELPPAITPERLRLILPLVDTVASAIISARHTEKDSWATLAAATFYRIKRDNSELESQAVSLPGIQAHYWRVHLEGNSRELPATLQLDIGWRPLQLVFLASGSGPYTLAFGNRKVKPVAFPLSVLLPGFMAGDELKLPEASTGALITSSAPADLEQYEIEWRQWALWGILITGVALLGWMAWRIRKDIKAE